jgi:hypothetical protein
MCDVTPISRNIRSSYEAIGITSKSGECSRT